MNDISIRDFKLKNHLALRILKRSNLHKAIRRREDRSNALSLQQKIDSLRTFSPTPKRNIQLAVKEGEQETKVRAKNC
jgi:hypothetical protein